MTSAPSPQPPAGGGNASAMSRNLWDFAVVVAVLAALLIVTVFLVRHYGDDATKAASVLGILAPIFAAVFGVSLGYATGTKTGKAEGEAAATQTVKAELLPKVQELDRARRNLLAPITRAGSSPPGDENVHFRGAEAGAEPLTLEGDDIRALDRAVNQTLGYLQGM